MAQIRLVSWNIQVYGPDKYAITPNNQWVAELACETILHTGATVVVLMELMSSVAVNIAGSIALGLGQLGAIPWSWYVTQARPGADRESYAVLWRNGGVNFAPIAGAEGLAANEFPNNFSATHGRRAAYKTFRTTDTNNNFAVAVYHAPPNNQAVMGVESLSQMTAAYTVNNGGAVQNVPSRMLAGDYNMDAVSDAAYFQPLTNPLPAPPAVPPPNLATGQGAGCTPGNPGGAIATSTLLGTLNDALQSYGGNVNAWPAASTAYRRNNFAIDNIYQAASAFNGFSVIDVPSLIRNPPPGSPIRNIANAFVLRRANGTDAFPHANTFPPPMNVALNSMGWAFLLYRYAISDHLPILTDVTV